MNKKGEKKSGENTKANALNKLIKEIEDTFNKSQYKASYELINTFLRENSPYLKVLIYKYRIEEKLEKFEDALITCNLVLFIQPNNLECHQSKLKILKNLQKFNYLSDCLVATMTLFPNLSFT